MSKTLDTFSRIIGWFFFFLFSFFFDVNLKHLLANKCWTWRNRWISQPLVHVGCVSPGISADPGSGSWTLRRCKYMPADEFAATGHWYAPSAASSILEHHLAYGRGAGIVVTYLVRKLSALPDKSPRSENQSRITSTAPLFKVWFQLL